MSKADVLRLAANDRDDGAPWKDAARALKLPEHLVKAHFDDFFYALGLKNGMVICFGEAEIDDDWVHLKNVGSHNIPSLERGFSFERGVQVRLSEIAWVADAPSGS